MKHIWHYQLWKLFSFHICAPDILYLWLESWINNTVWWFAFLFALIDKKVDDSPKKVVCSCSILWREFVSWICVSSYINHSWTVEIICLNKPLFQHSRVKYVYEQLYTYRKVCVNGDFRRCCHSFITRSTGLMTHCNHWLLLLCIKLSFCICICNDVRDISWAVFTFSFQFIMDMDNSPTTLFPG